MKTNKLKFNPNNPRKCSKDKLEKLMRSIESFPKMMELRPIVYDPETMQVLGGNQRLQAIKNLKMTEIPDAWVRSAADLTAEEKKAFIIKDNVPLGEWDFDVLDTEFAEFDLEEMGIEVPEINVKNPSFDDSDTTDEDVENTDISPKTNDDKQYLELICPECGHEYTIEKP